ncbi:hypothetical protein os1_29680 [Comamonadaceae bacterium OS-1]|nr:hypothetical protein os1_29680 [Comamonadaceae bacterium OS-1]
MRVTASAILSLVMFTGCASNPHTGLNSYLKKFDYTAFSLPRATDGVGTVIDFKNKYESIVVRADDCVLRGKDLKITERKVFAADLDEKINWNAGASFSIPKVILEFIDLAGIVKASGALSVKVSLKSPFEQYISRSQFSNFIDQLAEDDKCKSAFIDPKNLIINQTLGAQGLTYEFLDSSDNSISLSAKILDQVDLKPEIRRAIEGKAKLEANELILVGYRAWTVSRPAGIAGTNFEPKEISAQEVEARRVK